MRGKTGSCSACGYSPVAFDAACCPRCGKQSPGGHTADRFAGRGMLIGLLGGTVAGAMFGWASHQPGEEVGPAVRAFTGALLGAIPGLIVGLFTGLAAMAVADLFGWLTDLSAKLGPGPNAPPDLSEAYYCGVCRKHQAPSAGVECVYCYRRTVRWGVPGRESELDAQRKWEDSHGAL